MRVLGVIPARGGSKSIPKKNIADLAGKPLIAHTINSAQSATLLDRFIVSTDCCEIAAVARDFGASVPFIRPAKLATDDSDSKGVVLHALAFMERQLNVTFDAVMLLQPTTPFRKPIWIDEAITRLANSELDSVVSLVSVGAVHPYRMYSLNKSSELVPFVDGDFDQMLPRQKLPSVYIRSGDIYITRRQCILEQDSLIGEVSGGMVIDSKYAVNIDEPVDLEMARILVKSVEAD